MGVAALVGGRRTALVATTLAATVWAYDLVLKPTPLAPVGMAVNRGLDVLLGAGGNTRAAVLPAVAMAVHTFGVTSLSRGEVHGTSPETAAGALACTLAGRRWRPTRRAPPPPPHGVRWARWSPGPSRVPSPRPWDSPRGGR